MKLANRLLLTSAILVLSIGLLPAQQGAKGRKIGDFVLTNEAGCLEVLSQGRTGTCWSFATTSWLESEVLRINGKKVDLSEMYVVRNAIGEKARRYVAADGKAVFGEGGLSHDVIAMVKEHGIVPIDQYTGLPNGGKRHSHGELFAMVKAVLGKIIEPKVKKRISPRWNGAIMAMVDSYLGAPPKAVKTDKGSVSPQEYATKVLKLPLGDYVEVMSYGATAFHEKAKLDVPDNWMHFSEYLNYPIDDLMAGLDAALEKGYTVAVDMDVSEPGFKTGKGVARLPEKLEETGAVTQAVRDEMFKNGKTTDDHLMHTVGIARDAKGNKYYYTKNSWGTRAGPFGGYIFISENFMRAKILAIMVHKDALPKIKG